MCSIKGKEGDGCVGVGVFCSFGIFFEGGCKRLFFPLRGKGVKEMGVPFMSLMRGVFEGYMMRGVAAG